MTQEISKELMVIVLRNGVEMPIEKERLNNFVPLIETKRFIDIDGRLINTADIVGVFSATDMEDTTRRKNGQWKDKNGNWQDKGTRVCKCGNVIPFGKTCGYCY